MTLQATGCADWQTRDGWGFRPLDQAAVDHRTRRVARDLQQLANATAAVGRGRGTAPERSGAMQDWARQLKEWADEG